MKRFYLFMLSSFLVIVLISCSKREIPQGFIKYEMKTMHSSQGDSLIKVKGFADVKLVYPEITEATDAVILSILRNYVNNQILLALFKDGRYKQPEYLIEDFFNEYREFKDNNPTSALYWDLERNVSVSYSTGRIVSFRFYESSFLGGAHPNTNIYYTNYDLATGAKLELKDIFNEGFESKLTTIAEKKFRERHELKADDNLESAGFQFSDNKFRINNNLGFTKEGVVFYYNPYEVAPYVMGSTSVAIPYTELEGLIKEEYLPIRK